jgi:hypothetical protein
MTKHKIKKYKLGLSRIIPGIGLLLIIILFLATRWYETQQSKRSKAIMVNLYEQGMYAKSLPQLCFTEKIFDFGTLTVGELAIHEYQFTNTGNSPLIIQEVIAEGDECDKCDKSITVSWTSVPIQPGQSGTIQITFNTIGRIGKQGKYLIIRANTDPAETRLLIKGEVKSAL